MSLTTYVYIYVSVCQFTAAALTRKHHKVLHEMKMDFSRILSNLEKFWFSRKIKIWELHSPKILIGMKTTVMGKLLTQAPQVFVFRVKFSTAMTKAAWSVPKDPSAPTALRWLPAHTAIYTTPGDSLGSTVGLNHTRDNLSHSRGSWSRRGNPRWEADSDFSRTTSEPSSVPAYFLAL